MEEQDPQLQNLLLEEVLCMELLLEEDHSLVQLQQQVETPLPVDLVLLDRWEESEEQEEHSLVLLQRLLEVVASFLEEPHNSEVSEVLEA